MILGLLGVKELFKKPLASTEGERRRLAKANRLYNPYKDVPVTYKNAQGSVTYKRDPRNSQRFDASTNSPLVSSNTKIQNAMSVDSRNALNDYQKNGETGEEYQAYLRANDQAFEKLSGQLQQGVTNTQGSALHNIVGNTVASNLAMNKAMQDQQYYQNVVLGRVNANTESSTALQNLNSNVLGNLMAGSNAANTLNQNRNLRLQAEASNLRDRTLNQQATRKNNFNAKRSGLITGLATAAGAVAGGVATGGSPQGIAAGASLGGTLGKGIGSSFFPSNHAGASGYAPTQEAPEWGVSEASVEPFQGAWSAYMKKRKAARNPGAVTDAATNAAEHVSKENTTDSLSSFQSAASTDWGG